MLLAPKPEIILFGGEEGTAEICQKFNLRNVPEVTHNEFGTPLMNDLFEKAQSLATHDLICYINADIIVTQSFIEAINIAHQRWKRFVISCAPWRVAMDKELNFTFPDWEGKLRNLIKENGMIPNTVGMDIYLFPRGFYYRIPSFALGRTKWDTWLISKACSGRIPYIDATPFVLTVHPNHKKSAHSERWQENEESLINHRIAGWWSETFTISDVPYILERDGRLKKRRFFNLLLRRIDAIKFFPLLARLRPRKRMRYFLQKIGFYHIKQGF